MSFASPKTGEGLSTALTALEEGFKKAERRLDDVEREVDEKLCRTGISQGEFRRRRCLGHSISLFSGGSFSITNEAKFSEVLASLASAKKEYQEILEEVRTA